MDSGREKSCSEGRSGRAIGATFEKIEILQALNSRGRKGNAKQHESLAATNSSEQASQDDDISADRKSVMTLDYQRERPSFLEYPRMFLMSVKQHWC